VLSLLYDGEIKMCNMFVLLYFVA